MRFWAWKCTIPWGKPREDMKKGKVPSGMTKDVFMSMRLEQAVAEEAGFDLIVMGTPRGGRLLLRRQFAAGRFFTETGGQL